jgi:hypothetical protein
MKKSAIMFCTVLTSFSLMAFGYMNWSNPKVCNNETSCVKKVDSDDGLAISCYKQNDLDLVYQVSSRFINLITEENLHNAKSIIDILPNKATRSVETYSNVTVAVIHDEGEITEINEDEFLSPAQLKLLQTTDCTSNLHITANYKNKNEESNYYSNELVYYMSVLPEKQAEYAEGYDALIEYLKTNSEEKTSIIKKEKLKPGKVSFTITTEGLVTDVKLTSTSGYTTVDKTLVELITTLPGQWHSATNLKGEKVNQELVFFFGLVGC